MRCPLTGSMIMSVRLRAIEFLAWCLCCAPFLAWPAFWFFGGLSEQAIVWLLTASQIGCAVILILELKTKRPVRRSRVAAVIFLPFVALVTLAALACDYTFLRILWDAKALGGTHPVTFLSFFVSVAVLGSAMALLFWRYLLMSLRLRASGPEEAT